jgi:hypothetical protein
LPGAITRKPNWKNSTVIPVRRHLSFTAIKTRSFHLLHLHAPNSHIQAKMYAYIVTDNAVWIPNTSIQILCLILGTQNL